VAGVTTQDAVYRDLLARLEAKLSLNDAHIYIAHEPTFDMTWNQAVQIIPAVPEVSHPLSGTGLVMEDFQVAYWSRNLLDQEGHSTVRISDSTYGVLATLANDARAAIIQYITSSATLTVPGQLIRGSVATESADQQGWVFMVDTVRCGYEIAWVEDTA
jgi:hypothetical protein